MKLKKGTTTMLLSGPDSGREADVFLSSGWSPVHESPMGLRCVDVGDEDYQRRTALVRFLERVGWTIPDKEFSQWRMVPQTEQRAGQVNGFDNSRGTLRATNGILALIERFDGTIIEGHYEWFVADEAEQVRRVTAVKRTISAPKAKKKTELDLVLEEMFA